MLMPSKCSHYPVVGRETFRGNRAAVATVEAGQEELHEGQAESAQMEQKKPTSSVESAQYIVAWQDEVELATLPPYERVEVLRMLEPHHRMWDGRLGTVAATTHRIEVIPGWNPVHAQPYRARSHARVAEKTEIDRMLAQQVIEPATCEWASPIRLVPKPDETLRVCVDYWILNIITVPDTYPLPRMDECIDSLGDAVVFTNLDCNSGYWKIPVHPGDRGKTTFTSHYGTYRFLWLPFGLRNAPATFQRAIDIILSGVK
jgi:Reverse transcriptase (RNA-dependent DNA polymerase)